MHLLKTFEPTTTFAPMDPGQVSHLAWTYPKGYWPSLYNQVSTTSELRGLGAGTWAGLPSWGQALVIGGISAVLGYAAMAKFGTGYIKPALRKVGINLAGPRAGSVYNENGLTFTRWRYAAGASATKAARAAWRAGLDPADWRVGRR